MSKKSNAGRPKWIPTQKTFKLVEMYASQGLTKEQIADCLGISYQTLNEKSKEYSEFSDAFKKGHAIGIQSVSNKLFEKALNGDLTAAIFYLKCRAGWSEKTSIELSGQIDVTKLSDEQLLSIIADKGSR